MVVHAIPLCLCSTTTLLDHLGWSVDISSDSFPVFSLALSTRDMDCITMIDFIMLWCALGHDVKSNN